MSCFVCMRLYLAIFHVEAFLGLATSDQYWQVFQSCYQIHGHVLVHRDVCRGSD